MATPVYDLILEDGSFLCLVPIEGNPLDVLVEGRSVRHARAVRGVYRWPYLGLMLRNHWGKRHGAILS